MNGPQMVTVFFGALSLYLFIFYFFAKILGYKSVQIGWLMDQLCLWNVGHGRNNLLSVNSVEIIVICTSTQFCFQSC